MATLLIIIIEFLDEEDKEGHVNFFREKARGRYPPLFHTPFKCACVATRLARSGVAEFPEN